MMIGVITYNRPHRKTQDLVYRLILNGHKVQLIIVPYIERKVLSPIYKHRPSEAIDVNVYDFVDLLGLPGAIDIDKIKDWSVLDHVLIGGANIIDKSITDKVNIINAHPGYLPNVKGLDALKWAIYDGQPIGVTVHYITDEVDGGQMIDRAFVPVYFEDSFDSVARRVYDTEIAMLADAVNLSTGFVESVGSFNPLTSSNAPHKRMPHQKELIMMERFNVLRSKSNSYKG